MFKALAPGARLRSDSAVPPLAGMGRVTLSVRDHEVSARFYRFVLGFRPERREYRRGVLRTGFSHPCGVLIDLVQYPDNFKGRFDHRRCGLDRLTLAVDNLGQLEAWEDRFTRLDVEHEPVSHGEEGSTLVFRDPDGTALALFAPADPDTGED